MKSLLLVLSCCLLAVTSNAKETKLSILKEQAKEYYSSQLTDLLTPIKIHKASFEQVECYEKKSCLKTVCKMFPKMCDDSYDYNNTIKTCAGANGECIDVVCTNTPKMCDDNYDLSLVVKSCTGVNGPCVQAACTTNPKMCDDNYDLNQITTICQGKKVDGECVQALCDANPKSCDDTYDFNQVVQACSAPAL